MDPFRRLRVTMLAVMFAVTVAGCGPPEPADQPAEPAGPDLVKVPGGDDGEAAPEEGDWLIERLSAEPPHLNPLTSSDAYATTVMTHIFDGLLYRNPETLEMEPNLAAAVEESDDHLVYTFTLRPDAVFSDGTPVTAWDVKFTFDMLMDPTIDAPHLRNYFQSVSACEVINPETGAPYIARQADRQDLTVRFTCSKPYYRHIVMLGGLEVIPEHIYGEGDFNNHPNNRQPIGSGRYLLEAWRTNEEIVLARNPNYWGRDTGRWPYFDKRIYKIIPDSTVAFQVLRRGGLDADTLRAEDWIGKADTPDFEADFEKYEYYAPRYTYLGWNLRKPQFEHKMVRRALTMLMPREAIRDRIYHGLAMIMTGNFMPGTPEYNDAVEPWPFDPEQAQQLLDAAGWIDSDGDGTRDKDGVPFSFEITITNSNEVAERICTVYQEELRRRGIKMSIRTLEWASLLERINGRQFDAMLMGWSMPPDPDPYQVWHSSQIEAGSNYVGFDHALADQIIEEARVTFDAEKRAELYNQFHEILHEEQPYIFLLAPKELLAVDKRVRGVNIYTYGPDSLEWHVPKAYHRYGN